MEGRRMDVILAPSAKGKVKEEVKEVQHAETKNP
jgi:hypothetical protein